MKRRWLFAGSLILALSLWCVSAAMAQPNVSPEAEKIVQQMCDYLKSQGQFSYQAQVTYDEVGDDGKNLAHSFEGKVFVRRPDRLRVNAAGEAVNKDFLFDGKTITLYDKTQKVYGVLDVPPDIEAALEKAHTDFDLRVALADLASPKLGNLLFQQSHSSRYLGKGKVRGIPCHHLEVVREDVRLQVWIDAGKDPLLRKIIVTHKDDPDVTKWTAEFTDWDFAAKLEDDVFTFKVPEGVQKIKFVPAAEISDDQSEDSSETKGAQK